MISSFDDPSTFAFIYFTKAGKSLIRVPDFQRAFSWGQKQIALYINDLRNYEAAQNTSRLAIKRRAST